MSGSSNDPYRRQGFYLQDQRDKGKPGPRVSRPIPPASRSTQDLAQGLGAVPEARERNAPRPSNESEVTEFEDTAGEAPRGSQDTWRITSNHSGAGVPWTQPAYSSSVGSGSSNLNLQEQMANRRTSTLSGKQTPQPPPARNFSRPFQSISRNEEPSMSRWSPELMSENERTKKSPVKKIVKKVGEKVGSSLQKAKWAPTPKKGREKRSREHRFDDPDAGRAY